MSGEASGSGETLSLDNIAELSSHTVSTERVKVSNRGQFHKEGGWPKEIDPTEPQDTAKWRKRLDKDPVFGGVLKQLVDTVKSTIDENNAIDMFQEYFAEDAASEDATGAATEVYAQTNLSVSTVAVFKDQQLDERRRISKISFHPENPNKFLASYVTASASAATGASSGQGGGQASGESVARSSFIWDLNNPNMPVGELLTSQYSLTCATYYPKNAELIGSGTENGLILFYDTRTGNKPVSKSLFHSSHYEPVSDFQWLQSKTHSECVSASTDGRVLWWDVRNLAEPVDSCVLALETGASTARGYGGSCLEYLQEAGPTKFLVGTEEGVGLLLNKKPKKAVEIGGWYGYEEKGGSGRHLGPINVIRRNPLHVKYFLTIGDWQAKLWSEEMKAPLTQTKAVSSLLTCGGWSPTRCGLFWTGRQDGVVDIYDYNYRMNEVALSVKVSDCKLACGAIQQGSSGLMAVGDVSGKITLVKLCEELVASNNAEKINIGNILDRETRREKNLDAIRKQGKQQAASGAGAGAAFNRQATAAAGTLEADPMAPGSPVQMTQAAPGGSPVVSPPMSPSGAGANANGNAGGKIDEAKYNERETEWLKTMNIHRDGGSTLKLN